MSDTDPLRVTVIRQADDDGHAQAAGAFVDSLNAAADTEQRAIEISVVETASPDEAIDAARSAVDAGVTTIAAVGGDGALNLVVEHSAGADISVASVPAGTVNLVAQTVGLTDPSAVGEAVVGATTRDLDVGENERGSFVLNASSGYDATVIAEGADHSDAHLGRLTFITAGLRRLRRDRPRSVTVRVDGESWFDGRAMSVVVLNIGQRGSGSFDVAPDADPADGVLDVAVFRCSTIPRTAMVFARLALGRPIADDDILYGQGREIDVTWSVEVATQRDGDRDGSATTINHRIRPASLRIHCA